MRRAMPSMSCLVLVALGCAGSPPSRHYYEGTTKQTCNTEPSTLFWELEFPHARPIEHLPQRLIVDPATGDAIVLSNDRAITAIGANGDVRWHRPGGWLVAHDAHHVASAPIETWKSPASPPVTRTTSIEVLDRATGRTLRTIAIDVAAITPSYAHGCEFALVARQVLDGPPLLVLTMPRSPPSGTEPPFSPSSWWESCCGAPHRARIDLANGHLVPEADTTLPHVAPLPAVTFTAENGAYRILSATRDASFTLPSNDNRVVHAVTAGDGAIVVQTHRALHHDARIPLRVARYRWDGTEVWHRFIYALPPEEPDPQSSS
jgi:hypothetical protein